MGGMAGRASCAAGRARQSCFTAGGGGLDPSPETAVEEHRSISLSLSQNKKHGTFCGVSPLLGLAVVRQ